MATIRVDIKGVEKVRREMARLGERAPKVLAGALFREGERIMAESKQQVPVDTGNLRNTGHVALPRVTRSRVEVDLGYGGPAAPYALKQHEDLTLRHPTPGQKGKYLQDPAEAAASGMGQRLANEVRKELE